MRYSVTGESKFVDAGGRVSVLEERVQAVVEDLDDLTEFTTGAAPGVDTVAALCATWMHPNALHRVCIPTGMAFAPQWAQRPIGYVYEDVPGGYMARNDRLVAHADVLLAFPLTKQEVVRSGTWATIRRARVAGVEVRINPLT